MRNNRNTISILLAAFVVAMLASCSTTKKLGENDVVLVDVDDTGEIEVSRDDEASERARQVSAQAEEIPVEPDSVE